MNKNRKKKGKKLTLRRETLRTISKAGLEGVHGGMAWPTHNQCDISVDADCPGAVGGGFA